MGNWLQKILAPADKSKSVAQTGPRNVPAHRMEPLPLRPKDLPNATVIYGIGASLLFVAAFSLLVEGRWVSAGLVFVIGGCLVGFGLHLYKHQD